MEETRANCCTRPNCVAGRGATTAARCRPMAAMDAVEMNVPKQHEKLHRRGKRQQTEYAVCFQMAHCKI